VKTNEGPQSLRITDVGLISLELRATGAETAIETLVGLLDDSGKLVSREAFISDVFEREAAVSTELPWGIALPHARSAAVKEAAVCFGRSSGFPWRPESKQLTRMVFLLAAPAAIPGEVYMASVAALAKSLLDPSLREACLAAVSDEDVVNTIRAATAV
jgi:fructose PTS system EIIBC or EIIC component